MLIAYDGVKVFSAAKAADRERLGDRVTDWIAAHPEAQITETVVRQSSDNAFHCLSIVIFYKRS